MAVSYINLVSVDGDNFVDARSSCCSITGLAINQLEITLKDFKNAKNEIHKIY